MALRLFPANPIKYSLMGGGGGGGGKNPSSPQFTHRKDFLKPKTTYIK